MPYKWMLAAVLGLGTAGAVTLWVPEQGQTATLTAAGLKAADGRALSVMREWQRPSPESLPLSGGRYLRVVRPTTATTPVQVVVEDARKRPQATRDAPAGFLGAWPTVRGPCITTGASGTQSTRCWDLALKTTWATFEDQPVYVSRLGDVAYTTAVPDWRQPYSAGVPITRIDLRTGETAALTLNAEAAEPDPANRRGVAETYDARNTTYGWVALPGGRFLACVTTTLAKWGCRLDVLDRDARFLYTLQGAAYTLVPQRSQDGRRLYAVGNTLQVWDAATGKRLRAIHDLLWDKQGRSAVGAFLTPDGREAAIVTGKYDQTGNAHDLQVWRYALDTGRRLSVTALRESP